MAKNMVLTYLHLLDPEIPIDQIFWSMYVTMSGKFPNNVGKTMP
jgi:hypothetical protein